MKFKLLLLIIPLFIGIESFGQLVDHYRFQDGDKSLNLVERMDQQQTPGMLIYIDAGNYKDSMAQGQIGPASSEELKLHNIFPGGALSFAPVKMEILRLQQEGKLDLDDPIQQYLPELKDGRFFKTKEISIRNILLAKVKFNGPYKPSGYRADEVRIPLNKLLTEGNKDFPDGIKIKSSKNGSGNLESTYAILCQLLIEEIHQRPLAEIIKENIFNPIGMINSFYSSELNEQQELLAAKGTVEGKPLQNGYRRYEALASSGLWTTAKDYALLLRHVLDASKGIDNRILNMENARRGLYSQEGFSTLIFNSQTPGSIYGGGNSKGFYTTFAVDIKKDIIQVLFANADLVWPLLNFASGQTGSYVERMRDGRMLGIYIPKKTNPTIDQQLMLIESIANAENIPIKFRFATNGLPQEITALPALVLETPKGNSLYGGLIGEASSLKNFIRTSGFRAIPVKEEKLLSKVYLNKGSQRIVIAIKWTGEEDWSDDLAGEIITCMQGQCGELGIYPTDRKLYLDVHPYEKGDSMFLSYAVFSQFNCINPIRHNFGFPVAGKTSEKNKLINLLIESFKDNIESFLKNDVSGFALSSIDAQAGSRTANSFGPISQGPEEANMEIKNAMLEGTWSKTTPMSYGQPLIQFNFPPPLNRYAGEVKEVSGSLELKAGKISGSFLTQLSSLTMGMAELDAKVLKQYLKVKSNPTASFKFKNIPMGFNWDVESRQRIQGEFNFLGKTIPLEVEASIKPEGQDQSLLVVVNFILEITETFGMKGPDGPKEASDNLEFYIQLKMKA